MDSTIAIDSLAALAQQSRLAIFRLLVETGPAGLAVGDIGADLDVAPATLSFHLKELANAGLIVARQQGRFIYYSADFGSMNALVGYLTENCCGEGPCAPVKLTTKGKANETLSHSRRRS